jgi:hypothetical protein
MWKKELVAQFKKETESLAGGTETKYERKTSWPLGFRAVTRNQYLINTEQKSDYLPRGFLIVSVTLIIVTVTDFVTVITIALFYCYHH